MTIAQDGSLIASLSTNANGLSPNQKRRVDQRGAFPEFELWWTDVATGASRLVAGQPKGLLAAPDWHPNSSALGFIVQSPTAGYWDVWVADLDVATARKIPLGDYFAGGLGVRWSPDGSSLAFNCIKPGEFFSACTVAPSSGRVSLLTKNLANQPNLVSWSGDSRLIAFGGYGAQTLTDAQTSRLDVVDATNGVTRIVQIPRDTPVLQPECLAWSSDQTYGIYQAWKGNSAFDGQRVIQYFRMDGVGPSTEWSAQPFTCPISWIR